MSRYTAHPESCFKTPVIAGLPMGFDVNAEKTFNKNKNISISVEPAFAFIQLNSRDRNNTTSSTDIFSNDVQPWNDFRVQKPAPVLDSFGSRLGVSEVRFPWAIPNITTYNNTIYLEMDIHGLQAITIPVGFYSGTEIATAINEAIIDKGFSPNPSIAYDADTYTYTWTSPVGYDLTIYPFGDESITNYFTKASLAKTLGMNITQFGNVITGTTITGSLTQSLYTTYIDIVSSKLHYNNKVKDGSSAQNITSNIICRIMCSDETSSLNNWITGQQPFLIHRQYRNPKMIRWNPDSFIDWFDIQVKDEFGNLVYLTPNTYPEFQITLLVSEV